MKIIVDSSARSIARTAVPRRLCGLYCGRSCFLLPSKTITTTASPSSFAQRLGKIRNFFSLKAPSFKFSPKLLPPATIAAARENLRLRKSLWRWVMGYDGSPIVAATFKNIGPLEDPGLMFQKLITDRHAYPFIPVSVPYGQRTQRPDRCDFGSMERKGNDNALRANWHTGGMLFEQVDSSEKGAEATVRPRAEIHLIKSPYVEQVGRCWAEMSGNTHLIKSPPYEWSRFRLQNQGFRKMDTSKSTNQVLWVIVFPTTYLFPIGPNGKQVGRRKYSDVDH